MADDPPKWSGRRAGDGMGADAKKFFAAVKWPLWFDWAGDIGLKTERGRKILIWNLWPAIWAYHSVGVRQVPMGELRKAFNRVVARAENADACRSTLAALSYGVRCAIEDEIGCSLDTFLAELNDNQQAALAKIKRAADKIGNLPRGRSPSNLHPASDGARSDRLAKLARSIAGLMEWAGMPLELGERRRYAQGPLYHTRTYDLFSDALNIAVPYPRLEHSEIGRAAKDAVQWAPTVALDLRTWVSPAPE